MKWMLIILVVHVSGLHGHAEVGPYDDLDQCKFAARVYKHLAAQGLFGRITEYEAYCRQEGTPA